jgi:hypothetical protein
LPEGTSFEVRLDQALSSDTARREDRFDASVATPVRVDGRVVLPAGTRVRGVVDSVQEAERPAKSGRLDLVFDGISSRMEPRFLCVRGGLVNEPGWQRDCEEAGLGALLGGVLGSIVGGKKALVGVLIGGTGV